MQRLEKEECGNISQNGSEFVKIFAMSYQSTTSAEEDFNNQANGVCYCLVTKSYPAVFDSMNCSPPGSSVHGILQARILEWVAIPFSMGSSRPWDQTQISCISGRFFTV